MNLQEKQLHENSKFPLVSIVLPVYNVADYLCQSLDSVVNQTYEHLEIICVNDGSSDQSEEILEQYQRKDERIQVIHQSNQGVSAARNNGLDHATGKYIIFWDSDDFFELNAIQLMVEKAEKESADVCACDAQHFHSDTGELTSHRYIVPPLPESNVFSWQDCPEHIFLIASSVPWNKLVRLSLLQEHNIRFPDIPYLEDNEYMFLVMCCAKRITLVRKKLIYYRLGRPNSLVQNTDSGTFNVVTVFGRALAELDRRKLLEDPALRIGFLKKTASMYHYRIRYCSSYDDYTSLYDQFFSPVSPLIEYDPSLGQIKRIEDMKTLSAGDYLLQLYHNTQKSNDINKQKHLDTNKQAQKAKKTNEQLSQKLDKLSAKNRQLLDKLEKTQRSLEKTQRSLEKAQLSLESIKASYSFKIGKTITHVPRNIKQKLKP